MAETRRIPYEIANILQGEPVVDAVNVSVDAGDFVGGIRSGDDRVQTALRRLDSVTAFAAAPFNITSSTTLNLENVDDWLNRQIVKTVTGNRDLTLPSNEVFPDGDDRYPFSIRVYHNGGTIISTLSNRFRVLTRSGDFINDEGVLRTQRTLTLGQGITLRLNAFGEDWELSAASTVGVAPQEGPGFDIRIQSQVWLVSDGSFLPQTVEPGYAYRVNADGERFGVSLRADDYVMWTAAGTSSPTWSNTDNWTTVAAHEMVRVTATLGHLQETITEVDNNVDVAAARTETTVRIWLTPEPFVTAPFLSPSGDPQNPRPGASTEYVGGDDSNLSERFQVGSNYFQHFLYVQLPAVYSNANEDNLRLRAQDLDSNDFHEFDFKDRFRKATELDGTGGSGIYWVYTTNPADTNSETTFNYAALQILEVFRFETQRHFTFDADQVNVTQNVSNLPESALSPEIRGKLDREIALDHDDRHKLDSIVETSSDSASGAITAEMLVKNGQPSGLASDYYTLPSGSNDLPPSFEGSTPYTVAVPDTITLTGFEGLESGSTTVTAVTPSLLAGRNMYRVSIPEVGSATNFWQPIGTTRTITGLTLTDEYDLGWNVLDPEIVNAIGAGREPTPLPAVLQAISAHSRINHFDNTLFTSIAPHAGIESMYSILKNKPALGSPYPITADLLVNEITNSGVTVGPPSDLSSIYIPRTIGGQLDNGVEVITNGAMAGPGVVNDFIDIQQQDIANFRAVLGFRFFLQSNLSQERSLVRIKEQDVSTRRLVCGIDANGLVFKRSNQDGGTTSRTVTHTLYGTDGQLTHTFAGTASQEELWRVYDARTYTINARLISNGNDEGSTTFSYTVSDLNTSQAETSHTFSFTDIQGHTHSQDVTVSYVANTTTYGGPGHTLRLGIDQLADNENFDIDHLLVSATYETTETTTSANTYSDVVSSSGRIELGKLHKVIMSFRETVPGEELEVLYTLYGYDSSGAPTIYDENVASLNYSVFDLDYTDIRIGANNAEVVIQDIQGLTLNTDTPPAQYPTHAVLRDWMAHHDAKETDYVWDQAVAPDLGIEELIINENLNLPNQIITSPGGVRFRLSVGEDGALTTTKIE